MAAVSRTLPNTTNAFNGTHEKEFEKFLERCMSETANEFLTFCKSEDAKQNITEDPQDIKELRHRLTGVFKGFVDYLYNNTYGYIETNKSFLNSNEQIKEIRKKFLQECQNYFSDLYSNLPSSCIAKIRSVAIMQFNRMIKCEYPNAEVNTKSQDQQLSFELLPAEDYPENLSQSSPPWFVDRYGSDTIAHVVVYCKPIFEIINKHTAENLKEHPDRYTVLENKGIVEKAGSMAFVYPKEYYFPPRLVVVSPDYKYCFKDTIGIIVQLDRLRQYRFENENMDGTIKRTYTATLIDTKEGDTHEFQVTQEFRITGPNMEIFKGGTPLHSFNLSDHLNNPS